jgi:outer membrane immunogenic protein
MGDRNISLISTGAIAVAGASIRTDRISQDVDMVTARLNYKFGGPAVPRY